MQTKGISAKQFISYGVVLKKLHVSILRISFGKEILKQLGRIWHVGCNNDAKFEVSMRVKFSVMVGHLATTQKTST
jgi:hypothetical protein